MYFSIQHGKQQKLNQTIPSMQNGKCNGSYLLPKFMLLSISSFSLFIENLTSRRHQKLYDSVDFAHRATHDESFHARTTERFPSDWLLAFANDREYSHIFHCYRRALASTTLVTLSLCVFMLSLHVSSFRLVGLTLSRHISHFTINILHFDYSNMAHNEIKRNETKRNTDATMLALNAFQSNPFYILRCNFHHLTSSFTPDKMA